MICAGRSPIALAVAGLVGIGFASGQVSPAAPSYTLQMNTRIVLTDVTVTDAKGNPVQGLHRSDFHVFDNGRPVQLNSFTEHLGSAETPDMPPATEAPNTYSNDYLLHPPEVCNVLVIDNTTVDIMDQMYLNGEIVKFIDALPAGKSLAIYGRSGDFTLLLQNFTSDHALLLAAVHKVIPRLREPGAEYASDLDTLRQIVSYLSPIPGRKNVIWFSGGSNLYLLPDASSLPTTYVGYRQVYDELEAGRIAIYPVDARGLTVGIFSGMNAQHGLMQEVADATGGHAYYNNNGLSKIASKLVATDGSFYTLSYAPSDLHFDNKWHKVKVKLDQSKYNLSYRRGYFDDGANTPPPANQPRSLLHAGGEATKLSEGQSAPIIFSAELLPVAVLPPTASPAIPQVTSGGASSGTASGQAVPSAPKKGERTYAVRYSLPASAFTLRKVEGRESVTLGTGILALNQRGTPVARIVKQVALGIDEEKFRSTPDGILVFSEDVDLPVGEDYLLLAVWDIATGRLGTVQVSLQVPKALVARR